MLSISYASLVVMEVTSMSEESLKEALEQLLETLKNDPDPFSSTSASVIKLLELAKDLGGMSDGEAEILEQCLQYVKLMTDQ